MEANARSLSFVSTEGVIRIPFFQRRYVWDVPNWDALLDELSDTARQPFLGSLLLKALPAVAGEPKKTLVIDGQQRLTTLSILLKALHDTLLPTQRIAALQTIRPLLFSQRGPLDPTYDVKIDHSHFDAVAYQQIIRAHIDGPAVPPDAAGRPVEAYRWFVARLSEWTPEARARLFAHMCALENKMLVVIDLAASDHEQAIFDAINSAGVRLSAADIVKNALYQRAIEVLGREEAIRLYKEQWDKTFLADEETIAFWDEKRITGRITRDHLELLLHAVGVVKGFYDPEKHTLQDLAARYKDHVAALPSAAEVRAFAVDLTAYAEVYRAHFGGIEPGSALSFRDSVTRLLHILDELQISTLHPFVLHVLKEHRVDAEARLSELERFVVRRVVAGQEIKSFNKLAHELLKNPTQLAVRRNETTDAQVADGLRKLSNKHGRLLLFWLELYRRHNEKKHDVQELVYHYTLEHVMPQQWRPLDWPLPTVGADGMPLAVEVATAERNRRVYWLGNMTLLKANLNSSLRNGSFAKKIRGEGRKKGMAVYGTLSITKVDIVDPYEKEQIGWDETRIEARTSALQAEVLAIWSAPEAVPPVPDAEGPGSDPSER